MWHVLERSRTTDDHSVDVLATSVEVKKAKNEEVELSGTLSAKAGTAACGTLTNGDRVEVEAARQSNGTVLATRVEKKK